ncbi:hypothetical protein AB0O69_03745 [Streptomyces xiamenensis]|uniref:hypothetical protein n=1 Tax=Streptomyces xiamenensis TaxID=408015 RepID=UPI003413FC34
MTSRDEGVGTRLNGWDEGPGSADADHAAMFDLEIDGGTLTRLSSHATALGGQLTQVVLPGLQGDGEETGAGLESEAALRSVLNSWRGRLSDVEEECVRLSEGFTSAAGGFAEAEAQTQAEIQRLNPSWAADATAGDAAR